MGFGVKGRERKASHDYAGAERKGTPKPWAYLARPKPEWDYTALVSLLLPKLKKGKRQ